MNRHEKESCTTLEEGEQRRWEIMDTFFKNNFVTSSFSSLMLQEELVLCYHGLSLHPLLLSFIPFQPNHLNLDDC